MSIIRIPSQWGRAQAIISMHQADLALDNLMRAPRFDVFEVSPEGLAFLQSRDYGVVVLSETEARLDHTTV